MKVLVIGASGTIGRPLCVALRNRHQVVTAGGSGGDVAVDIISEASIEAMYRRVEVLRRRVGRARHLPGTYRSDAAR